MSDDVLQPDELEHEARVATGLEDFGDGSHREGLEVYCESVTAEAQLNDIGRLAVRGNIIDNLSNRLRVIDWVARNPDAIDRLIEAPLIVIGMFRAGTTFLSNLLDQDPRNRSLLRWEAGDSVPPPVPEDLRSGPRVDAARSRTGQLEQLNPRMAVIHHEDAGGPTECVSVLSQDFKSLSWEAITNVPTYGAWLRDIDQRSAYDYHRTVLGVLQAGGARGRWTLKSPHHALALDELTTVYPDARLVLLHRDPVLLCGSVCSLVSTLTETFSDADHRSYIAEHWPAMLERSIARIEAFRGAHPSTRIVDIHYDELVRSPVATVAAMYRELGDELTDEARTAIDAYVTATGGRSSGRHRYDLAEFGLDSGDVRERFASYVDRHDIPLATGVP